MTDSIRKASILVKEYYKGNINKVKHFVNVYTLAKHIGESEKLPDVTQEYLELEALVHEIDTDDKITIIKEILEKADVDTEDSLRICHVIENKDKLNHINGLDHQILIEADFIVHAKEKNLSSDEIAKFGNEHFMTYYGKALLKKAFNI